jgi:hypothetical protein
MSNFDPMKESTSLPASEVTAGAHDAAASGDVFSSNAVRLTPRQWLIVAVVLVLFGVGMPRLWQRLEPLGNEPDYRIAFRLGNDYWLYRRICRRACVGETIPVLGDSVVWGHYVPPQETLSHYLNAEYGREQFANLGVDGIHPAAMAGLVEYFGRALTDRRVVLHCNLLWMSSKRHDLQVDKPLALNHPTLVPQFFPAIPCYRASFGQRVSNVVARVVPFLGWTEHVRTAYFGGATIPEWTLAHPYEDPFRAITLKLPSAAEPPSPRPDARPWTEQKIGQFGPHWVDLAGSFQWRSFQRTVAILERRGNRLFVVVGPFNEHMLTPPSRAAYRTRIAEVADWLEAQGIEHVVPAILPSDAYADASHPLADGYALLARQLAENRAFAKFALAVGRVESSGFSKKVEDPVSAPQSNR